MKWISASTLFLFFLNNANGTLKQIDVNNLNIEFDRDSGQSSLNSITIDTSSVKFKFEDFKGNITSTQKIFKVDGPLGVFEFRKGEISFLKKMTSMFFENFNLDIKGNFSDIVADSVLLNQNDGSKTYLREYESYCKKNDLVGDIELFNILESCFYLGRLTLKKLESFNPHSSYIKLQRLFDKSIIGQQTVENVQLYFMNGSYTLKLKATSAFNQKFTMSGNASISRDESKIKVHIAKAKIGFISIKSKLLKAIKDAEMENVVVDGDNVFITVKH